MKLWLCSPCVISLAAALYAASGVMAAEFKRFDGLHRIEKQAQITPRAVLLERDGDSDVCGSSMKPCPSSLNGGCCPDNYDCAKESCYATTKGPSTCGTLVGWHACEVLYGGGCCPDGYMCETAGRCVPPSGSPYTFGCPASHYLCPSSMSYGCCPSGMGCAVNQCYSTESITVTTEMKVTTTKNGNAQTYTTMATTVQDPDIPTELPDPQDNDQDDQPVVKYFPSSIPKESPTASSDKNDGGVGGLTTAELAGIITGAVAFLVIVIVAAFIIIRHLNKVVAVVGDAKQSSSSPSRPAMKGFKPTDSEVDAFSVDPLMMSPRQQNRRHASIPGDMSSTEQAPSSFAGAYHPVSSDNSRHTSFDNAGNPTSYFDAVTGTNARYTTQSPSSHNRFSGDSYGAYAHVRHWSNASEESNDASAERPGNTLLSELEAKSIVPELPGSPSTVDSPLEGQRRRSSGGTSIPTVMSRPPVAHQRMRTEKGRGGELGVVDEEIHGPPDQMVGHTDAHRPSSRDSCHCGYDATT